MASRSASGAIFTNAAEGGRSIIEFYDTRDNPAVYRADKDALTTTSEAVLVADITYERPPRLPLRATTATTAGGAEIHFSRLPDFSFEVVEEPKDSPQLVGFARVASDWELY
jgi:hypothetical protein